MNVSKHDFGTIVIDSRGFEAFILRNHLKQCPRTFVRFFEEAHRFVKVGRDRQICQVSVQMLRGNVDVNPSQTLSIGLGGVPFRGEP